MYKQQVKIITIIFVEEIPIETFDKRFSDAEWAQKVKKHLYRMGKEKQSFKFTI